jgi:hypothetical protein
VRIRINCSSNASESYELNRTYIFYSNNLLFEEIDSVSVLDEDISGVSLESQSGLQPYFNQSSFYNFNKFESGSGSDKSFYFAARDAYNATGKYLFWLMGRGDYSGLSFSDGRDSDAFKYTLNVGGMRASGRLRYVFHEGDMFTSKLEYERFITPLATIRPIEENVLQLIIPKSFDRAYDPGKAVVFSADTSLVYGVESVGCTLGDLTFLLYDDGSHGDLYSADGTWTNSKIMWILSSTPTGEYEVFCTAQDRKNNSVSSSSKFSVFDRGTYHKLDFSVDGARVRPAGSSEFLINVTNRGDFPEYNISLNVRGLPSDWNISLPASFDLGVNESMVASIIFSVPAVSRLGSFPLLVGVRSLDAFESLEKTSVSVGLSDIEVKPTVENNTLILKLTGDDNKPIDSAAVSVSVGNITSNMRTDDAGLLRISAAGNVSVSVSAEKVGYVPLSVRLGLRPRYVSNWFPITAAVIIVLTLLVFWYYRRLHDRDPLEDAFALALVLGVFITLTWVGLTMRGPEAFTALYFADHSYSNNLSGNTTKFTYVVDCHEYVPTQYNLSVYLNNQLVNKDTFWLGGGDSVQPMVLEQDKVLYVPAGTPLPARVRVVLFGGNRTYDIHYFLRARISEDVSENLSCSDGVRSFGESDVDCGGLCLPCEGRRSCSADPDCLSGFCSNGKCVSPSCFDGVMDQGESMVDCGGQCLPCHCFDGARNFGESSVDCGGSSCARCGISGTCRTDGDCRSVFCSQGYCMVPSCFDGIMNQNEAEIDCGGPCAPCPSCFDEIMNQGELDVDCEGPCGSCDLVHENRTHLSWVTQVDGFVTSLRFSPDRSLIAVAWNDADGYITLYDDQSTLLWTTPTLSPLSDVRFTEDGKFISPHPDSETYLFDLNGVNRVIELRKRSDSISSVCGVPRSSDVFLTFDRVDNLWTYSLSSGLRRTGFSGDCIYEAGGSALPDNRSSLQLNGNGLRLWNYVVRGSIYSLAVSGNGSYVAAGAGNRSRGGENFIYSFDQRGRLLWKYQTDWNIYSLTMSSDGNFIFGGSLSGRIYLLNKAGKLLWTREVEGGVLAADMLPNGNKIIVGTSAGKLYHFINPLVNCSDRRLNMGETDVDCGGPCGGCRIGSDCRKNPDCVSGYCRRRVCSLASCSDGVKNQLESGVDCGGPCKPCNPKCRQNSDCGKELSNRYCYGDFVMFAHSSPQCIEAGTLDSFCETVNETVVSELCLEGRVCEDGYCVLRGGL